jgi:hypothetical protein
MSRTRGNRRCIALGSAAVLATSMALLPGAVPSAGAVGGLATGVKLLVQGLDNPRGLAFGSSDTLYVGEAGHAGGLCVGQGPLGPLCVGETSQIGAVDVSSGKHSTLVGHLASLGTAVGATGVDGVATFKSQVYGIMTLSPGGMPPNACAHSRTPSCQSQVDFASDQLGNLIVSDENGGYRHVASVGSYNYPWVVNHKAMLDPRNPDFEPGDANPYGVFHTAAGTYVVDGGSNTLDLVDNSGRVKVLKTTNGRPVYLPNPPGPPDRRFPYDSVPTCVTVRDGVVWMGTLSGEVWRYDGPHLTRIASRRNHLTAIGGCAMDAAGNLIVSNVFGATPNTIFAPNTGTVMKVTPRGVVTLLARGLNFPAGVAVSSDNKIYVAVNSVCPKSLSLISKKDPPFCRATGAILQMDNP